jgi:peptidoglycan/xylan/chitin deacetylase (PgdA/CDA1 family)
MKLIFSFLFLYIFSQQAQAAVTGCNCVVFRLDDIQDVWLSNTQQKLISTFREQQIPLTIGIIAQDFGTDQALVSYINASLYDSKFQLEIADHGWAHEDFTTFTYASQLKKLQDAIAKIKTVLPVVKTIKSFIPPYNAWNNNTLNALTAVGITYMSSQTELDPPPYYFSGKKQQFMILIIY